MEIRQWSQYHIILLFLNCMSRMVLAIYLVLNLITPQHQLTVALRAEETKDAELPKHDGHLKPFGCCGEGLHIMEMEEYPNTRQFFEDHVSPSVPLKMKNAFKNTAAFQNWEDDYFLNLDVPPKSIVFVEQNKKENRTDPSTEMPFKEFVKQYKHTDQYMVQPLPHYLRQDVTVPHPLQCEEVLEREMITDVIMWFSSGGTKSVVHTDSLDNINCVVRGTKELVMVNPSQRHLVDLDHPEGAYSDIDVDRVDYNKYPGLAHVDYYHVTLSAGDCLYIPYLWIHQVRSYDRNIAINVWWSHRKNKEIDLDACDDLQPDPDLTIADIDISERESDFSIDDMKEYLHQLVVLEHKSYTVDEMTDILVGAGFHELEEFRSLVEQMVSQLDKNGNMLLDEKDLVDATEEDWNIAHELAKDLTEGLMDMEDEDEEGEEGFDDYNDFYDSEMDEDDDDDDDDLDHDEL